MRTVLIVLLVLVALAGSIPEVFASPGLTLKAGLGYEYMSQEFFVDSLSLAGADSVDVATALKTTYLDDYKGHVSLGYLPYDDYTVELKSTYEQAEDQFRLRFNSSLRPRIGRLKLDWSSEIDWRDGTITEVGEDEGYLSGYSRVRLSVPASDLVKLYTTVRSDFVRFDQVRDGVYNYHRLGGQVGMVHYLSNFSSVDLSLFGTSREVSESTDQDYLTHGLEATGLIFYSKGELDGLIRHEIRDYDREGELGDYSRTELSARHRHDLGPGWFAREELEIESIRFDSTDLYTSSYQRTGLELLAGYSVGTWSIALGPALEGLNESRTEDLLISEDYKEAGLKVQLDLIQPGLLFGSLESVTGRRNLADEGSSDSYNSDFTYERLNLFLDWSVAGGLSFNILLSADWEWHENENENSRLALVTSGLYYTF